MVALWVILGIVVLVILWVILLFNGLVRKRNVADEAWSGISVQLKRRHDLIPNLVATAKGLSEHEKTLMESVTAARAAKTVAEVNKAEAGLSAALRGFVATVEAYPQIKADQGFMNVMSSLSELENDIQMSRRYYNGAARDFNTSIQVFPANLFAGMLGFSKYDFFELENPEEAKNPQVQF
ncbi:MULTISPECIES: LemA family protein [Jonquetella]|uniref:LemA family protein n=1 Tax=Jonquetella anthropi DSM 22815 TaxID=885272 RepID=H0UJS6_9BACT|nr:MULTISPECIES: LemA family protein [Jonquetella]EHM12935.1 hypothetical protein JonanDRAFT_0531 [Jonquetella anthropi DSM 22815]ERL23536.1 LemA family protein [Jonquetella sp. BV3C21]